MTFRGDVCKIGERFDDGTEYPVQSASREGRPGCKRPGKRNGGKTSPRTFGERDGGLSDAAVRSGGSGPKLSPGGQ